MAINDTNRSLLTQNQEDVSAQFETIINTLTPIFESNPENALEYLLHDCDTIKDDPFYTVLLGLCYRKIGKKEDALAQYTTAFTLGIGDPIVCCEILELAWELGEYKCALDYGLTLLEFFDDSAELYVVVGQFFLQLFRLDEALPLLKNALKLNPNHVGALNALGQLYIRQGDYTKAVYITTKALSKYSNNIEALYTRAQAYSYLSIDSLYEQDLERIMTLTSKHFSTLLELGKIRLNQWRLTEAIVLFTALKTHFPDQWEGPVNLTVALHLDGQLNEAQTEYTHSKAQFPDIEEWKDVDEIIRLYSPDN